MVVFTASVTVVTGVEDNTGAVPLLNDVDEYKDELLEYGGVELAGGVYPDSDGGPVVRGMFEELTG